MMRFGFVECCRNSVQCIQDWYWAPRGREQRALCYNCFTDFECMKIWKRASESCHCDYAKILTRTRVAFLFCLNISWEEICKGITAIWLNRVCLCHKHARIAVFDLTLVIPRKKYLKDFCSSRCVKSQWNVKTACAKICIYIHSETERK